MFGERMLELDKSLMQTENMTPNGDTPGKLPYSGSNTPGADLMIYNTSEFDNSENVS